MLENKIKFNTLVENQLPKYVIEEFPVISEFLKQYYISQEYQGSSVDLIQSIDQYIKLDNITNVVEFCILGNDISVFDDIITINLEKSPQGTKGFPKEYGLLKIDDEIITYTGITSTSFVGCKRGFSGIESYNSENNPDELVFKSSESSDHSSGSKILNLSSLFLKEFLTKIKYQLLPGFESRELNPSLNESLFIKQSKDFYSTKGTEKSFEILFKSLYGEKVKVIKPKDYLFRPSDAQYQITNDFVVESIEGDIYDAIDSTLIQDSYEFGDYTSAYGPITNIKKIISKSGKSYYQLSIDAGYSRDIRVDGAIYGNFSVHPKTKVIDDHSLVGITNISVDSTVGFPPNGHLYLKNEDTTLGIVSYSSKSVNQFLDCVLISNLVGINSISNGTTIGINTFAYAYSIKNPDEIIKIRINSVIKEAEIKEDSDNYNHSLGTNLAIKTLGINSKDYISNNWIFNLSPTYKKCSVKLKTLPNKYEIKTVSNHILTPNDYIDIENTNNQNIRVSEVLNSKTFTVETLEPLFTEKDYSIRRRLSKVNINDNPNLLKITSDVQNVYKDREKTYVSSNSLPSYGEQPLTYQDFSLSGRFITSNIFQTDSIHYFETGDSIFFDKDSTSEGLNSGLYFVEKVNNTELKFYKNAPSILSGSFLEIEEDNISLCSGTIKFYNSHLKELQPQKLLREISPPLNDSFFYQTSPGSTGILINGTEIVNYKSKDKVYYGKINSIEVLSSDNNFDVINPPILSIEDANGTGASGYCSVNGSLFDIKVTDPGFDYLNTPQILIEGGSGVGAKAEANVKLVDHEVQFDAIKHVTLGDESTSIIGFSTYHKFRHGERVIYKTNNNINVGGISTNSLYYLSVKTPTQIQLHKNFEDFIAGIGVSFTSFGLGIHNLKSENKKITLGSISILDSGSEYKNKKITTNSSGISTVFGFGSVFIENHGYNTGDIINYSFDGSPISGLSENTDYFVVKLNDNTFTLSEVGTGETARNFYYTSGNFINFSSSGIGTYTFNYPSISVRVVGEIGVSTIGGSISKEFFESKVNAKFRGKITSIYLENKGFNYGSEILNFQRDPEIKLNSGGGAILTPIISSDTGKIIEVFIVDGGNDYNSPPTLSIVGDGIGAVLEPTIKDGKIDNVFIIESGRGYKKGNTAINVVSTGGNVNLLPKIQSWTINLVERYLNSFSNSDDGFIFESSNKNGSLQYGHLYYPREFRKLLNENLQSHSPIIGWAYDGNPIYGPYAYKSEDDKQIVQLKSGYKLNPESVSNRPSFSNYRNGFFVEDYEHFNYGSSDTLDVFNGRFCSTPEFPQGTYAYFCTFLESTNNITNLIPSFPYFIGDVYRSKPKDFNFSQNSNQDKINLNSTSWSRNTTPYGLLDENIDYPYLFANEYDIDCGEITSIFPGSIESIDVLYGGFDYKVGDNIVFDSSLSGYGSIANVSKISGKEVSNISIATSSVYDIEIYPYIQSNKFLVTSKNPHNLENKDFITIAGLNTSSYIFNDAYEIDVLSNTLALNQNVDPYAITGIVTYFSVVGNLRNFRENDILKINLEKIKILNIDNISSRIRVLRQIDGTVGSSHSYSDILYEQSKKLVFKDPYSNFSPLYKSNKEIYFNPSESLSIGTGVGNTIRFSSPGVGATEIFIPTKTIYLPNHQLNTGDELIYSSNTGNLIQVSINGITPFNLTDNSKVYVAKITDNLIGIATVRVGVGTTGEFVGITSQTKDSGLLYFNGVGTKTYHSFKTNYESLVGRIEKNIVTVSTAQSHGLLSGDVVEISVNPSITTSINVKYNDYLRRVVLNSKSFTLSGVNTTNSSITIPNHGFTLGQKIIYNSDNPTQNLKNNGIYFVHPVDNNIIKICESLSDSISLNPKFIGITTISNGSISPINPPLRLYKNSVVIFDLSDSSLSYIQNNNRYPAFDFSLYTDSNFKNPFNKLENSDVFEVQKTGIVGSGSSGALILTVKEEFPNKLYYKLNPIISIGSNLPIEKKESLVDGILIQSNNTIEILNSGYNGEHVISVGIGTTNSFTYNLPVIPESFSYSSGISSISYQTSSINALGPISKVKLSSSGKNYYSLPKISNIISYSGKNSILYPRSKSIGKIKKSKIKNIGFDFSSDYTLSPNNHSIVILKVEPLYAFDYVNVLSYGVNYIYPPKLVVIDGKTNDVVSDIDLKFELNKKSVSILSNIFNLNNVTPKIIPINNTNGIGIKSISMNEISKEVTVVLTPIYESESDIPFNINDKILIENVNIVESDIDYIGYNSENYNYSLFTVTSISHNPTEQSGSITYSLNDLLSGSQVAGTFDEIESLGKVIPEKYFPIFDVGLKIGNFLNGELVKCESSQGYVENWDPYSELLTISKITDEFEILTYVYGLSSNVSGLIKEVYETNSTLKLNSSSTVINGWISNAGFLNNNLQRIQDSFYYQNFSYSLKSKIDYDTWKDPVFTLNHPRGFKGFSDYQMESEISVTPTTTSLFSVVTVDISSVSDLNTYYNFDYAKENYIRTRSNLVSDEILFETKILQDYISSIGNRVLPIDDISLQFDSESISPKRDFILKSEGKEIFKTLFEGNNSNVVSISDDTITINEHFFVTGEKIFYSNSTNNSSNSIGIATTSFVGIGLTNKLPNEIYVVKINDNKIKLSRSAEDALKTIPDTLNITSVGIGSTHYFTTSNQNSRAIISLDNVIQSPISKTNIISSLSSTVSISTNLVYLTGISSFFSGDLIQIDDEIVKITGVGIGSTNGLTVYRSWMGTTATEHLSASQVTKISGNYNIIDSTINFSDAPLTSNYAYSDSSLPTERSTFHGRVFIKSGTPDQLEDSYANNYIFDDISNEFSGISSSFTLKTNNTNITGISSDNIILLINNIAQIPSQSENELSEGTNYLLKEQSGVTTIFFGSSTIPNPSDINTTSLPIKGIIVSVGSTEGFGYQPLVSAGGTVTVSISGTISGVSIGNSGSGYRSGVQPIVKVGVKTSNSLDSKITYIGTASINNGNIVSVAITNPGSGYSPTNPPKLVIDSPLPYSNIPLIYSSDSPSGIGTQATIDIVVGNGSSIMDFKIKNYGYNYNAGDILTVPVGGSSGIPTTSSFKQFKIFVNKVKSDKFSGWYIGNLTPFDDISFLFNGKRKRFPIILDNNYYSLVSEKGSKIDLKYNLLVFLNDVLQLPDESYTFSNGNRIVFKEAPKGNSSDNVIDGDICKILFYAGNKEYDTKLVDILETVKTGDELKFEYNFYNGQSSSYQQDKRTVSEIFTNSSKTLPYFGSGIFENDLLSRPISWRKQTEDKIIDFSPVYKDRPIYEPLINPFSYIINSVGIGSSIIYVDSIRPIFNAYNESVADLDFQKQITLISQNEVRGAIATCSVSAAGTITSINLIDNGVGYVYAPEVTIECPVGFGTTQRATATASISGGSVTNILVGYGGTEYNPQNLPEVLIGAPSLQKETNKVISYTGDYGIISGISTSGIATALIFDLLIPNDSYLKNSLIVGNLGITTISGISAGDYFVVYNTNIGNGVTSLNSSGSVVGIATSCLNCVYVADSVSIATTYIPSGGASQVLKVTAKVQSYNGISGLGFSSFYGEFSWGKIVLKNRSKNYQYNSYTQNGVIGIKTGSIVSRSSPLRYFNYKT